jgi:exosortase
LILQRLASRVSRTQTSVVRSHNICFLVLVTAVLTSYWRNLANLVSFSFARDQYSYIVLIPVVSLALVLRGRAPVFANVSWAFLPGMSVIVLGLAGAVISTYVWPTNSTVSLSAAAACVWALLVGTFALCYGTQAVRAALFPVLFLALMVPFPERLLDGASVLLQKASCQLTYLLITVTGTPVLRSGFVLSTPLGGIEVAEQCSGIRSTLGLLIGSIVAGHLFLRSAWKKTLLASGVIPVSIFKNALRIVTLYWLGVHTDQRFLTGELHRRGGIPFSALALVILGPILWLLYESDARVGRSGPKGQLEPRGPLEYVPVESRQ